MIFFEQLHENYTKIKKMYLFYSNQNELKHPVTSKKNVCRDCKHKINTRILRERVYG